MKEREEGKQVPVHLKRKASGSKWWKLKAQFTGHLQNTSSWPPPTNQERVQAAGHLRMFRICHQQPKTDSKPLVQFDCHQQPSLSPSHWSPLNVSSLPPTLRLSPSSWSSLIATSNPDWVWAAGHLQTLPVWLRRIWSGVEKIFRTIMWV